MLKRAAIAFAIASAVSCATLLLIDLASSFLFCVFEKIKHGSEHQQIKQYASEYQCDFGNGIISAGIRQIAHWHAEVWIAIGTIIIAIFTIILGTATVFLWRATRDLVIGAENTTERQLRAYLYLDITFTPYPPPPQRPNRLSVSLEMKNSGTSWARNVRSRHGRAINPTTTDPFDSAQWDDIQASPIVIGPGQTFRMQFPDITQIHLTEIISGEMQAYYVAWVTYEDIFGRFRQTQTSRKFEADAEGGAALHYMPTHNCADDDCPP
jgi:hypothetical protein